MKARIPILMNLYRGGAAIVLGILLLFLPDVSKPILVNLMGFFWLTIGFSVLRSRQGDKRHPGRRTAVIAGLVGIVTGLLVITQRFTRQWLDGDVILFVLGTVILATGFLHMFSEVRLGNITSDGQTGVHFLLGLFEVLLGGLLILSRQMDTPILIWVATAWALVYGVLFVGTAVGEFLKSRQETNDSRTEVKIENE